MGKQTKQKTNSSEESLLNKIKQLEADNFLLSSPQGLTTVGPLPSTSGSNTIPATSTSTTTTPTTNNTVASGTTTGTAPIFSPTARYRNSSSFNESESVPVLMNEEAIAKAEAQKAEEERKANEYNSTLAGRINTLNSTVKKTDRQYDDWGNVIPSTYTPMAPLPVMPKEIDVPNMVVANHSKSYGESKSEGTSGGGLDKPKYFLKNTKLKVDAGTGTLGVETVDTPNYSQDSGIDTLSKKSNLQNVRVLDNYFKQGRPRAFDKNTTWNVEIRASDSNKSLGNVGMKGDMFDAVTRHAGNSIMKLAPDLLDMSKVTKDKDGTYNFAGRSLPLKKEKAYDILDGNGKRIPFDKGTWDKVKDKPGYDVVSNIRYDQLLNDIVAQFQASNGMPNTGRYDKKGALYTTYDQATKDAMNSSDWKAFEEQHLNNQRVSDAAALKWKLIYGNTL